MMNIERYKTLISNLPVRQQCFTTKRKTWNNVEKEIEWLKNLNEKLFDGRDSLTISRQDIFDIKNTREKIIKAIYWGYPSGMRGDNFANILQDIDKIEEIFEQLNRNPQLKTGDFVELNNKFKEVKGLGLSTYSKLLYFFNLTFNGNPCLILDQRLIDVFNSNIYSDFQKLSGIKNRKIAENRYLNYLQLINDISKKLNTEGENIEQFLFTFGNNLK